MSEINAPMPLDIPALLNIILTIKTPQLIGIIAGIIVFHTTVITVILLLYYSGTFSRLKDELSSNSEISKSPDSPQFQLIPQLYDHLLQASDSLPVKPNAPSFIGRKVILKPLVEEYIADLILASNGSALYSHGAYDPYRIWGWFGEFNFADKPYSQGLPSLSDAANIDAEGNSVSLSDMQFKKHYTTESCITNSQHIAIFDPVIRKPIGMLSLLSNDPKNLSIKIGKLYYWFVYILLFKYRDIVILVSPIS